MISIHRDPVSALVRQILIIEKRQPIRDVASALGMEYANFHARVTGRTRFKAAEMSSLISEIPDPRLCDVLLRNTPFVAVPRPASQERTNDSALRAATRLVSEGVAAIERIGEAMAHGTLDPPDYDRLAAHVAEAERAVCVLRQGLLALAPRTARRSDNASRARDACRVAGRTRHPAAATPSEALKTPLASAGRDAPETAREILARDQ
jgi:uncharacterized glyoxalase superfamily metalloenzyme YdcJ